MLRERYPEVTVADVYEQPTLGALADRLGRVRATGEPEPRRRTHPAPGAGGAAGAQRAAVLGRRAAVAHLDRARQRRAAPPGPAHLGAAGVVVGGGPGAHRARQPRRTARAGGPRGPARCCAASARAATGAAVACTSGCGSPRAWRRSVGAEHLAGAPWMTAYARALGAKVGRDVDLHAMPPDHRPAHARQGLRRSRPRSTSAATGSTATCCTSAASGSARAPRSASAARWPPAPASGRTPRSRPAPPCPGPCRPGELWAGSPATLVGAARHAWPRRRPRRSRIWVGLYAVSALLLSLLPAASVTVAVLLGGRGMFTPPPPGRRRGGPCPRYRSWRSRRSACTPCSSSSSPGSWGCGCARATTRCAAGSAGRCGRPSGSSTRPAPCCSRSTPACSRPLWLRPLGARVGRGVEASTVLLLPRMTTIGDERVPRRRHPDRLLRARRRLAADRPGKVGKRAFLGNSGMAAPGPRRAQATAWWPCCRPTPARRPSRARRGSGSPPVELRRTAATADGRRTFAPPTRLKVARAVVELVPPGPAPIVTFALGVARAAGRSSCCSAAAGSAAAGAARRAGRHAGRGGRRRRARHRSPSGCWSGRIRAVEHPLWSSFVWRNELADTFVEMVAAPWFARCATGHAGAQRWLRASGARIGRGVWCETLLAARGRPRHARRGATVNRGCVVQTHLFHDRIMSMDRVDPRRGCHARPARRDPARRPAIGAGATVGPASLVMRGETVPGGTAAGPATRSAPGPSPTRGAAAMTPGAGDDDRPLPARARRPRLLRRPLRPRPRLPGRVGNQLDGPGRAIDAVATDAASTSQPRPGRAAGDEGHRRRPPPGTLRAPRGQAAGSRWARRSRAATEFARRGRTTPAARGRVRRRLGRGRLGGADRRRDRRRPAQRGAVLVPLQRPARRQGQPTGSRVTTDSRLPRGGQRDARRAGDAGRARTTWVYEQPEPMATYLATVQIGRYELVDRSPRAGAAARRGRRRTAAPRLRTRLRPPAAR